MNIYMYIHIYICIYTNLIYGVSTSYKCMCRALTNIYEIPSTNLAFLFDQRFSSFRKELFLY